MSNQEQPPPPRVSRWPSFMFGLLVGTLFVSFSVWRATGPRHAIEELPGAERRALYDRTIESLETVCRSHESGLTDFCHDQAEMVLRFPECDDACRALAAPYIPRGTR